MVERESNSLVIIEDGLTKSHMKNMHNMNYGVLKIEAEYKTSKSAIGFTICKDFPTIQIIDTNTLKVIKTYTFKGKVFHVRWSNIYPELLVSVNGANMIVVTDTRNWLKEQEIYQVEKLFGIFIYYYGEKK